MVSPSSPAASWGEYRQAPDVQHLASGREGTPLLGRARTLVYKANIFMLMKLTGANLLLLKSSGFLADSWELIDP